MLGASRPADMYGGFIVPPDDNGAHLGVLFWHKDGFSTACGHGTIALGVWAVDSGRVAAPSDGSVDVLIDVPSGRVTARVHREGGRTVAVDFVNVPSWVVARDVPVTTSRGPVTVTVAYGGAIYATLPAAQLGLPGSSGRMVWLIANGRSVNSRIRAHCRRRSGTLRKAVPRLPRRPRGTRPRPDPPVPTGRTERR